MDDLCVCGEVDVEVLLDRVGGVQPLAVPLILIYLRLHEKVDVEVSLWTGSECVSPNPSEPMDDLCVCGEVDVEVPLDGVGVSHGQLAQ